MWSDVKMKYPEFRELLVSNYIICLIETKLTISTVAILMDSPAVWKNRSIYTKEIGGNSIDSENSAIWKRSTKPNLFGGNVHFQVTHLCLYPESASHMWQKRSLQCEAFMPRLDEQTSHRPMWDKQTNKQRNKQNRKQNETPSKQEYHHYPQKKARKKKKSSKILLWRSAHWDDVFHHELTTETSCRSTHVGPGWRVAEHRPLLRHKLTTKTSCRSTHVGPGRRVAEHRSLFGHKAGAGAAAGPVVQLAGGAEPLEVEGQTPGPSLAHLGACSQAMWAEG